MKSLYITAPPFFDLEISLIRELSKFVEVDVLEIVNPNNQHSSAFSLDNIGSNVQLVNACYFDEMGKYSEMIDLKRWNLAICPNSKVNSMIEFRCLFSRFVNSGQYDIIHNTTYSKELLSVLPKIFTCKHRVMTIHDPLPHESLSFHEKVRFMLYQKVFDNRILLSDALLDEYIAYTHTPKENIFFSRLSTYDFLTKYNIQENRYGEYILFFGRITKYKGVDILIEAYKKSKLFEKGTKLIIAGKGSLECQEPAEQNGVIILNKYIENDELASLIRYANYVVLPYRSATQSGCVMSAFAFNKPILATNVGDLPKEVENNVTGIVVESNNVNALVEGLHTLNDKSLLKTMSANIENKYQEDSPFSWSMAAKQILEAYNSIINK